jgi:hypothetical protein
MMVLQLIGLGLLLHEGVYVAARGLNHFSNNIAPVLGLRVSRRLKALLHALFIATCIGLVFRPEVPLLPSLALGFITIIIASFPARLPNHLVVAWFFLAAFVLPRSAYLDMPQWWQDELALNLIRGMTIAALVIAAFHKLNRDFWSPRHSCCVALCQHYWYQHFKSPLVDLPSAFWLFIITIVVVTELITPWFLLVPESRPLAAGMLTLILASFGFLAHVHFAVIMLAGVVAFLPISGFGIEHILPTTAVGVFSAVVLALAFGNYNPYRFRVLSLTNHAVFAFITIGIVGYVLTSCGEIANQSYASGPAWSLAQTGLIAGFILNGLCPYIGVKFDFSLQMFSNLRLDRWNHWIITHPLRLWRPRYVQVVSIYPISAQRHLEYFFPFRDTDYYAMGYAWYVAQEISHICRFDVQLEIHVAENGTTEFISSRCSQVRCIERLSVFPYHVPMSKDIPLCA